MPRLHHLPIINKRKLKKPIIPPIPISQEHSYQKDLKHVVALLKHAVDQLLLPQLHIMTLDANKYKQKPFRDDATDDTDRIFKKIALYLDQNVDEQQIAKAHAVDVTKFNALWFQKQMEHMLGINVFSSDTGLQDHLKTWIAQNVDLIKSLQGQALQQVKYQVHQGFLQGLRPESIAKHISERLDVADSRAQLIGRDQVSKLNGQLNQQRQSDLGIDSYVWHTAGDERVRESHAEKEGETFQWSDPPPDTGHPGEDINCFLGQTPFFSLVNVKKFFRRRYCGEATTFVMENGELFTCTPNHPIYADRGVIAAKDLNIGDNIACVSDNVVNVFSPFKSDIKNTKTTLEQVFDFLSVIFPTKGVDGATKQFHGDGIVDKNIDIIALEGCLLSNFKPILSKDFCEIFFAYADMSFSYLPADRDVMNCLRALGFSSDRFISFFSKLFALFASQGSHSYEIRLRAVSDINALFNKSFGEALTGNIVFFGKHENTIAPDIFFDKLFFVKLYEIGRFSVMMDDFKSLFTEQEGKTVAIAFKNTRNLTQVFPVSDKFMRIKEKRVGKFAGNPHVYNLETNSNSYIISDGLLVSNCRCVALPQFSEDYLNG